MKNILKIAFCCMLTVGFQSCKNSKSLQKYIVEKSENPDFFSMNISPKELLKSSIKQNENPLEGIENINVLVLKNSDFQKTNSEYHEIKTILDDEKYQDLVRTNSKGNKFQIDYIGSDDNIKEVVILIRQGQERLALLRVLTNGLTINQLLQLPEMLKDDNIDSENITKIVEKLSQGFKK